MKAGCLRHFSRYIPWKPHISIINCCMLTMGCGSSTSPVLYGPEIIEEQTCESHLEYTTTRTSIHCGNDGEYSSHSPSFGHFWKECIIRSPPRIFEDERWIFFWFCYINCQLSLCLSDPHFLCLFWLLSMMVMEMITFDMVFYHRPIKRFILYMIRRIQRIVNFPSIICQNSLLKDIILYWRDSPVMWYQEERDLLYWITSVVLSLMFV